MTFEQLAALIRQLGPGQTISLTKREVADLFGLQTLTGIAATILGALDDGWRPLILVDEIGDELIIGRRRLGS